MIKESLGVLYYDIGNYELYIRADGSVSIVSKHKRNIGNELSQWLTSDGYLRTKLNSKNFMIHAIVAVAVHGPRPAGLVINHKDGNKLNNHPSNLEYCTVNQNIQHSIEMGFHVSNDPKRSGRYKHGKATKGNLNAYKLEWYHANKK